MLTANAGTEFQASVSGFQTSLTGTVGVQILDTQGNVITARGTAGIEEIPTGSGTYMTTLLAPTASGNYLVFWDEGAIGPSTSKGEVLVVPTLTPVSTDSRLPWLRRVASDMARTQAEQLVAPGNVSEFFVRNPPITTTPIVTVNGQPMETPAQFTYTSYSVIFNAPPAQNAQITIRYARTTFTDSDLDGYIAEAKQEYTTDRHIVYRAAIYVIDAILLGAATALDFGSGQESFAMSSVFNRLMQLREMWETWLEENVEAAQIIVTDMLFDSLDPGFPAGFDPDALDYSQSAPTGAPPGLPGAWTYP